MTVVDLVTVCAFFSFVLARSADLRDSANGTEPRAAAASRTALRHRCRPLGAEDSIAGERSAAAVQGAESVNAR